jgi:hypothetical protein
MLYGSKDFAVRRHASFHTTTVQTTGEHTLPLFGDSDFTCMLTTATCVFTPLRTLLVSLCFLDQADGWQLSISLVVLRLQAVPSIVHLIASFASYVESNDLSQTLARSREVFCASPSPPPSAPSC